MPIKQGMTIANQLVGIVGKVIQVEDDMLVVEDGAGKVHELCIEDCVLADGHRYKASELFGVDYFRVTPAQRQAGKMHNFHNTYAMRGMKLQ